MSSIKSVDQLLTLTGVKFLEAAYQSVLGRAADTVGEKHYLDALGMGVGKAEVLKQLAESKEARAHVGSLVGLADFIKRQSRARHWFWGNLLRGARIERQANRIEHQLGCLADKVVQMRTEAADRFVRMDAWISHAAEFGGTERHMSVRSALPNALVEPWTDTSSLSQPARQIFARLNQARALREQA